MQFYGAAPRGCEAACRAVTCRHHNDANNAPAKERGDVLLMRSRFCLL